MKEPLKHANATAFNAEEDAYALQLLHMDDEEVNSRLEHIAVKNAHYSVTRIHNSLPLKKTLPNLSLIGGSKLKKAAPGKTRLVRAVTRGFSANTAAAFFSAFLANIRSPRAMIGVTGLLAACLLVVVMSLYKNTVANNSEVAIAGIQENIPQGRAGMVNSDPVDKSNQAELQQPQPDLPSSYSNRLISLPDGHPVFDSSALTIAIDSCRQCHSEVFAGTQQLL